MKTLSAFIITLNEERNIGRCLESISEIADEIVVVDSGSTDLTREICGKYNVRFIAHPFAGYIEQKTFALEQCSNEYVLSLDADEALSPDLIAFLKSAKDDLESDAYVFNRLTNYCGKWIRHCGWYPDKKLRLFKKSMAKIGGVNPHDEIIPHNNTRNEFLKGDILHYSYYSIKEHIAQVNRFTEINARSAFERGKRTNIFQILISPAIRFFRDFILYRGFLDGYYGWIICRISAQATFLKYVKLYELQKRKKHN